MRERDRLSLQAWRERWSEQEEAERIKRERPLREVEAQFKANVAQLNHVIRDSIQSGRDPEVWIDPETQGPDHAMDYDTAREFNRVQAAIFAKDNSWYYPCAENHAALIKYCENNGLAVMTAEMWLRAAERLRQYGLLRERPALEPVTVVPEPVSAAPEPPQAPTYDGFDLETGEPRTYSEAEVRRMSSLQMKRAFKITKDRQMLVRPLHR